MMSRQQIYKPFHLKAPGIEAVITLFKETGDDKVTITPINEQRDLLDYSRVDYLRRELRKKGVDFLDLRRDADISQLQQDIRFVGKTQTTRAEIDSLLKDKGHYFLHVTDCLTFSLVRSVWILSGIIQTNFTSTNFHMFPAINPGQATEARAQGPGEYLTIGPATVGMMLLKDHTIRISKQESALANRKLVLLVDAHGYDLFRRDTTKPLFAWTENTLVAPCRPPPAYVRPLAIVEDE